MWDFAGDFHQGRTGSGRCNSTISRLNLTCPSSEGQLFAELGYEFVDFGHSLDIPPMEEPLSELHDRGVLLN